MKTFSRITGGAALLLATLIPSRTPAYAGHPPVSTAPQRSGAGFTTVSAVIGDRSFIETFGTAPTALTSEKLRVSTHHAYVERLLRARDVSGMPAALRAERERNLDRLHDYWKRGIYPVNRDHPEGRFPCFIDGEGRICAVGYLVEQSAGRAVAEDINREFQYATIAQMHSEVLEKWIAGSGLTRDEVATIQPVYEPAPPPSRIGVAAVGSITFNPGFKASSVAGSEASHVDGGSGNGWGAQITFEKPIGGDRYSPSLMLRAGYEERMAEIEGPGVGLYASVPDRDAVVAPTFYQAVTTYRRMTGDILYSGGDERKLRYSIGVSFGLPLKGTRRETLTLDVADPGLRFAESADTRLVDNGRAMVVNEDAIDDRSALTLALRGGLRFPIITFSRKLTATPALWYEYGLTGLTKNGAWRANAIQLGMDIQYQL